MITKYEAQVLQQSMNHELAARKSAVYKCAAGIALVLALSIVGPVIGLQSQAAPQAVASMTVLDRLAGMTN